MYRTRDLLNRDQRYSNLPEQGGVDNHWYENALDDWLGPYIAPTYPQYSTLIGPQHAAGAMVGFDGRARLSDGAGNYTLNAINDNGDQRYIINRLYVDRIQDYEQLLAQPQNASQEYAYPLFPSSLRGGDPLSVWTPDWLNDAFRSMVIEKVQGTSTTVPVAPEAWQKWIVGAGGDAHWVNEPGVVGSVVGCIATYVVASEDNSGYWVYRQPSVGDFTYDLSTNQFSYYDVSNSWLSLGHNLKFQELLNWSGPSTIAEDNFVITYDAVSDTFSLQTTAHALNAHTDTNLLSGVGTDQYMIVWDQGTSKYILKNPITGLNGHSDTNLTPSAPKDQWAVVWDQASGKYILAPGTPGPAGPKGDTGATGAKGDTGATGAAGADGTGVFFGASVLLPATTEFENPAGIVTTGAGSFNFLIPNGYTKARFWVQFAPSATTTKKAWGIRWTTTAPGGGGAYTDLANSGFGALGEFSYAPALTYTAPADPGTGTGTGVKNCDYSEILTVVPGRHYEIVGLAGPTQYRHGIELWQ